MPKNPDEIGALWTKDGKRGKFMSGYIEVNGQRIDIVIFSNDKNANPKAPNARILKSQPRANAAPHMEDLTPPEGMPS